MKLLNRAGNHGISPEPMFGGRRRSDKVSDRRRRGEALGISVAIESAMLALLIVVPLMTSAARPATQPDSSTFADRHGRLEHSITRPSDPYLARLTTN